MSNTEQKGDRNEDDGIKCRENLGNPGDSGHDPGIRVRIRRPWGRTAPARSAAGGDRRVRGTPRGGRGPVHHPPGGCRIGYLPANPGPNGRRAGRGSFRRSNGKGVGAALRPAGQGPRSDGCPEGAGQDHSRSREGEGRSASAGAWGNPGEDPPGRGGGTLRRGDGSNPCGDPERDANRDDRVPGPGPKPNLRPSLPRAAGTGKGMAYGRKGTARSSSVEVTLRPPGGSGFP